MAEPRKPASDQGTEQRPVLPPPPPALAEADRKAAEAQAQREQKAADRERAKQEREARAEEKAAQEKAAEQKAEQKAAEDKAAREAARAEAAREKQEQREAKERAAREKRERRRDRTGEQPAVAASTPAATSSTTRAATTRRTRRAQLRLVQVDAWSVMKTSFLLSIALGIVLVVSVAIVWSVLGAAGVWDSINSIVQQAVGSDNGPRFDITEYVGTSRVLGFAMIVAVVDVILITAIATLAAFLYNLSAALLGGIEVTLAEDN